MLSVECLVFGVKGLDHVAKGAEERLFYVHILLAVPGAGLRVEG